MTLYDKTAAGLDQENPDSFDVAGKAKIVLYEEVQVSPSVRKALPLTLGSTLSEIRASDPLNMEFLGDQDLVVTTAAVATLTPPVGATLAVCQMQGTTARARIGGAPTNTVGVQVLAGGQVLLKSRHFAAFKIIAETGSGKLFVLYYKEPS